MSTIRFTSDLHFGHVNILKYTPQRRAYLGLSETDGVDEMNEALVDLWNAQVAPDDITYVVGDMCMGKVQETIRYVSQLNGAKCLVMGNHDRPHPMVSNTPEKRTRWEDVYLDAGFISLDREFTMSFDGINALVNHFPYYGDHTSDRYNADEISKWVPRDEGLPLVHGHVHDLWKTEANMYNLGIDAWDGVFQTPEAIGSYFRSLGFTA